MPTWSRSCSRRDDAERRVEEAAAFWADWSARLSTRSWREAVVRSALALKLLAFAPSGCIVAAPTTSLPERIEGTRNWDYRFPAGCATASTPSARCSRSAAWPRRVRVVLVADALDPHDRAGAASLTVDGGLGTDEEELTVPGVTSSAPVRVGNAAAVGQLDTYGSLLEGAWRFWSRPARSEQLGRGDRGARGLRRGELAAP